jgi:hypothetical protein
MEHLNPQNDIIDRYLKGELGSDELTVFENQLKENSELRAEVEMRRIVVDSIRAYGAKELKQFLQQRTKRKSLGFIKINTWYYAAAAVGLILIGSITAIYVLKQKNSVASEQVAAMEDATENANTADNSNNTNPADGGKPNTDIASEKTRELIDTSIYDPNDPGFELTVPDREANAVVIADNISVVSIKISSLSGENVNMRQPTGSQGKSEIETNATEAATRKDTGKTSTAGAESVKKNENTPLRLKLRFLESKTGEATYSFTAGTNTLELYNLPVDNPLLFSYQNRYFLKTGNDFYEIALKAGIQKAIAITDKALLKVLNQ